MSAHNAHEIGAADRETAHVGLRANAGRPLRARVEQRQLADEVAGAELGLSPPRLDLNDSSLDHEQPRAGLLRLDQDAAGGHVHLLRHARDLGQRAQAEACEERDLAEPLGASRYRGHS